MNTFKTEFKKNYLSYIVNIIISIIFLLPFLWVISTSFKLPADIATYPPEWIPRNITFQNYRDIFTINNGVFSQYFLNSLRVTIATILAIVVISSLAGYAFSKLDLPFNNIFLLLILMAMMIPFHGLLIPLFSIMQRLSLLNTHAALVLIYVTFQLPFTVFMMKNSYDAIPNSIRESALIDGASEFTTYLKIFTPLTWPGLATITVYSAYTTWNDFIISLIFANDNALQTLNVGLTNLAVGTYGTRWGILSAGAIVSFIPMILLFAFLQKYFISGLTSGAVK